ncbi:hypothetical protein AMTRI_Chr13g84500 [Amborella trichopoda]
MMRKFTDGSDLVKPRLTRFATSFLFLDNLNKQENKIQTMFGFALWILDSKKEQAMGSIHKAMEVAREEIKLNLKQGESKNGLILKIIDDKWDMQLERPLHLAGYFLKPAYLYSIHEIERKGCFKVAINKSSWWANHGQIAPNLQRMAQRILNLSCTSSGYNPIPIKDLDPTSEWLVEASRMLGMSLYSGERA